MVIGADWNLLLTPEGKMSTPSFDFPTELLPVDWSIHTCNKVPTVRSAEKPYERGSNFTAVIDGFVCSPGIVVEEVRALDLDFQHSDHNPVEIIVSY